MKTNVILEDHLLSVEPKHSEPACFASYPGVDPAMFHLDVCIVTTIVEEKKATTSPAASSVSTSLSLSQSPKVPSQSLTDNQESNNNNNNKSRIERAHIVLHIDRKLLFQVDLAKLLRMELHEHPGDDTSGVPANLVLHFDSCSFRIFYQEALGNNQDDDCFGVLKTAASRMKKAISAFQKQSIVFQGNEEYMTPLDQNNNTDNSGMSSHDAAQCENHHSQTARSSQEHGDGTAVDTSKDDSDCASVRGVKRKRSALDRSWQGLHSLQTILSIPRDSTQTNEDVSDSIAPILSAAADELAASYCRNKDIRQAKESCSNDLSSCEAQLNNVLAAAFPPPTRNRRNGASPAKTTGVLAEGEHDTQALLETAQALLQKQKSVVKERLELSLMLTRD